ncbi:MAG: ATP-binding cassette domain-containing protein [SAR324 cluster bacterium]|nr:ATP-binding cassette domain-containing protein [SAR324 cluster bacterium]
MIKNQLLNEEFNKPLSLLKGVMALPKNIFSSLDLVLATLLINILALALPLTLMQTYDRIIPNQALGSLFWLVIGCLIAMLFEFTVRISRSFISGWMAARFEHQLSCNAIDKLLSSSLEDYERFSVGTHMDRMNSIYTLKRFYAGELFQVLLDLPFSVIFLFVIWFLGKGLVLVPIFSILALFLVFYISRIGFQLSSTHQVKVNEHRFSFILQLLSRIHMIKSMTMEEQMLRRYETLQDETAEVAMRVAGWRILPSNVGSFFSQMTIFGVIILGATYVVEGVFTLGIVTACSMMSSRAVQPLQSAISFWLNFTEAKIAKSRLQEIADMSLEATSGLSLPPGEIDGAVSIRNLSFRNKQTDTVVLKEESFSIKAREMVGVTGDNPQDITSFLLLLTGKMEPDKGAVFIDDFNVREWDFSNLKGIIEYVPKEGTLFKGNILENITLFDPMRTFSGTGAARLLGIDEDVAKLPLGYQTQISHQTAFLSSGLIQRISMARALVVRPKILLIDHADDLMDANSEQIFLRLLERLKGKCTIFLVSSSPKVNALVDRKIHLADGRLNLMMSYTTNNPKKYGYT